VHGNDWRTWPAQLRRPGAPAVEEAADRLAERVSFHAWLQSQCVTQLAAVHDAARTAGMPVGVVHDLAVGTDPAGADAWELQDALVLDAHIGAPPDPFNQQGQDWGLPPWHPVRLAQLDYGPLRELTARLLEHAGGVRVDHVLGMFRAWWVPAGDSPSDGTYVSYDADAMLDAVTGAAIDTGAIVVGEDLGTTPKTVRDTLADRGVLGTSVLWFEREAANDGAAGPLKPPAQWREPAMASISTHDLPTALGWWRGEHVRVRRELGLLDDPDAEHASWERERAELLTLLRQARLLDAGVDPQTDETAVVRAMHLAVASTPSRYVMASLGDAVGDLRQPNLPGTTDEYPNWRLPVTDADGRVMLLDDLLADRRVSRLADDLTHRIRRPVR
jgi:4-alpha-glucanotransferase